MPPLTQRAVNRYVRWKSWTRQLEKRLKPLRNQILAALAGGLSCPERGPWLLEAVPAGSPINWRAEFAGWLAAAGMEPGAIEQTLNAIESRPRPSTGSMRLEMRPNPRWRRSREFRLPR